MEAQDTGYIIQFGMDRSRIGYGLYWLKALEEKANTRRITWSDFGQTQYSSIYVSSPKIIISFLQNL